MGRFLGDMAWLYICGAGFLVFIYGGTYLLWLGERLLRKLGILTEEVRVEN